MIHGKKIVLNNVFYLRKHHFCPACKIKMKMITVSKVVNSKSPEAKLYDPSFSSFRRLSYSGNVEFSWKEFKCPSCARQITVEEMQKIEQDSLDEEQLSKQEKKEKLKVFAFKIFMCLFAILLIIGAFMFK